jgi:hypothetical protein
MFMVAAATGDPSNVSNLTAGDSIPEWRLVPNDNNIGQRNVFPVAGGGGLKALMAAIDGQTIRVKNPHLAPARMVVTARLPKFLATRGWTATFDNPGEGAFTLKPGEVKGVVLRLKPGNAFTAQDVINAKADAAILVTATADGIVVGGMSYVLDARVGAQPPASPGSSPKATKPRKGKKKGKRPAASKKRARVRRPKA